MEISEWTVAPLVRDSFSMIGSAVGGTTSAFYGFNHVMPIVKRFVKGPMWVHVLIGAPPVIMFSSACAGLNEKGEHERSEGLSREELFRLVASCWTGKKTRDQVEEIDPAKSDQVGNRDKEESVHEHFDNNDLQFNEKTQKHQEKGRKDTENEESVTDNVGRSSVRYKIGSEDPENSSATISSQSWLDKIQETAQNLLQSVNLFSTLVANLDANQVRKEYNITTLHSFLI